MSKENYSTEIEIMTPNDKNNHSEGSSAASEPNQEFKLNRCSDWIRAQCEIKDQYEKIEDESLKILSYNTITTDSDKPVKRRIVNTRPKKTCTIQEVELTLECEWKKCHFITDDYNKFQMHVKYHMPELLIREKDNEEVYVCLWDVCYFESNCSESIVKHVNFHAYHTKLKAVGFNLRELNHLPRCTHDSTNRNTIPESLMYICGWDDCTDDFRSAQEYFDHIKCHVLASKPVKKSDVNLYCGWKGCKAKRTRAIHLLEHCRVHTGEKLVACVHCGTMFSSNTKLADHCLRQIPLELCVKKNFVCTNCNKFFPSNRLLRDHLRLHINNYKCSLCDMTCTTPSALAKHIRYRHVDDRVFKCCFCSHACVTKRDLQLHMSTHDEEKKYSCEIDGCTFRCKSVASLSQHMVLHRRRLSKHSSDKVVDEEFLDSDHEIHSEEDNQMRNVYCCHCCNAKYMRGCDLTKHLIKMHGFYWPPGHSRFTYKVEADGNYRLQTTRYENIEISDQILNTAANNELLKTMNHTYEAKIECPKTMPDVTNIILKSSDDKNVCHLNYKSNNMNKRSSDKKKRYKTKNNCDIMETESEWFIKEESNQTDSNLGSIEDFSVMKRYINDNKNIIITLDEVDERGKIIKSQTFNNACGS